MDAISVGLLILAGLNGVVWWRVWQQWQPRWPWAPWLRERLWWQLVRRPSVATPLVARVHRWAQHQTRCVDVDTHGVAPCVLCGNPRHTAQEHIRVPQWELEGKTGGEGGPGAPRPAGDEASWPTVYLEGGGRSFLG